MPLARLWAYSSWGMEEVQGQEAQGHQPPSMIFPMWCSTSLPCLPDLQCLDAADCPVAFNPEPCRNLVQTRHLRGFQLLA